MDQAKVTTAEAKDVIQRAAAENAEADALTEKATAPKKATAATNSCLCGCGGATKSRFVPGHDGRLKGKLLKEAYAGDPDALVALNSLGWGKFFDPTKVKGEKGGTWTAAEPAEPVEELTPEEEATEEETEEDEE